MRCHSLLPLLLSLVALPSIGCTVSAEETEEPSGASAEPLVTASAVFPLPPVYLFKAQNGGKCIDVGPAPHFEHQAVGIYDCSGSEAQKIVVSQVDPVAHQVKLVVGNLCIGAQGAVATATTPAKFPTPGTPLELQTCSTTARGQTFVLDGDSIVLATIGTMPESPFYRERLVVEVERGSTRRRTPLVLGTREVDDAEVFTALDPTSRAPIAVSSLPGGCSASTLGELKDRLARTGAAACSIIDLTADIHVQPTDTTDLTIPAGTTLRGGRSRTAPGYGVFYPHDKLYQHLFHIGGDDVRVTGIHLRGPWAQASKRTHVSAIRVPPGVRAFIDHDEIDAWTAAAVDVNDGTPQSPQCALTQTKAPVIHVVRNFLHHNNNDDFGYGVAVRKASVGILGNTFDGNRHAITGTYDARTNYYAYGNLTLTDSPVQGAWPIRWWEHDFDVHGSGEPLLPPEHTGGTAGGWFEIGSNTFLGTNRPNTKVRGTPCVGFRYTDNVSLRSQGDALDVGNDEGTVTTWGNQYGVADPTKTILVGDLDGDGKLDAFMATGAAWYYRSGNTSEWRFLQQNRAKTGLKLQDWDIDGRADVVYVSGNAQYVSYGGTSSGDLIGQVAGSGGGGSGDDGGGGANGGGPTLPK